jgi:accessory gene regulator protein AgrB
MLHNMLFTTNCCLLFIFIYPSPFQAILTHFINSTLKFKYQPGQIEVNQLVVGSMVRVLRYQVVTILVLNMLLTLAMVSYVQE